MSPVSCGISASPAAPASCMLLCDVWAGRLNSVQLDICWQPHSWLPVNCNSGRQILRRHALQCATRASSRSGARPSRMCAAAAPATPNTAPATSSGLPTDIYKVRPHRTPNRLLFLELRTCRQSGQQLARQPLRNSNATERVSGSRSSRSHGFPRFLRRCKLCHGRGYTPRIGATYCR